MREKPITRVITEQLSELENLTNWERVDSMSDEEAEQNALADPDNQPLSKELLENFRVVALGNRSVSVGGSAKGSVIQTGDRNTTSVQFQQVSLPQPEQVNIQAELDALREILSQLRTSDQRKIKNAISDAEEELKKPEPDKDEVGQALDRALNYAQKAQGFAEVSGKLQPHVVEAAAWLGKSWKKILSVVGLTI